MFENCKELKTIYASDKFTTGALETYYDRWMFNGDTKLRGGNGTVYDRTYRDVTYARIDADGQPGYFTLPVTNLNR